MGDAGSIGPVLRAEYMAASRRVGVSTVTRGEDAFSVRAGETAPSTGFLETEVETGC